MVNLKVDFHSHFYPLKYVKALERRKEYPIVRCDDKGKQGFVYDEKRSTPINNSFYNIDQRIRDMNIGGVDKAVLTLSNPLVLSLSELVNDELAKVAESFPERFICFAVLPYDNISKAVDELHRAVEDLKLKGLMLPSNFRGEPIDSPRFHPIFEEAERLRIPILIHPVMAENKNMEQYLLETTVGFPFETSLAISRLIFSGVLEKHRKLNFILAHAGGAIPYLIGRIDQACKAFKLGENLSKLPSEYLKQVFIDTICFKRETLSFAKDVLSSDNLLFGTDCPFAWGTIAEFVDFIKQAPFTENEKEKIFSFNAFKLLGL